MSIDEEDVKKVARLARIRIDSSEVICANLDKVVDFVKQLEEVDCPEIDGKPQCSGGSRERCDVAIACDPATMDNAPEKKLNMFVVPKIIG